MNLDTLCHTLTNLYVVLTAHVLLNVGCKVVACHADRVVRNNSAKRYYGNLGRAAAYINNHVALWSLNVETDTDGCRHWLEYQINVASAGMFGRIAHGTKFNLGRTRRHADNHSERRREQVRARVNHLYQTAHHLLASVEIGNHAVAQRAQRAYILISFFIHHLGLLTNGNHVVGTAVKSHHRWLVYCNLAIRDDDGICSTKVHRNILDKRKKSHLYFSPDLFVNYLPSK